MAETIVQYNINTDGSLTAGSMPSIQVATGSNGSVGGVTESPGFYDSTNGMVVIPIGGYCVFASKVATFSHESCHPAAAKLPPLSSL